MDGGAARGLVGIPLHPTVHHARNPLQPHVRHRGHDTGRSRGAIHPTPTLRRIPKQGKPGGRPRPLERAQRQKQDTRSGMQAPSVQKVQLKGPTQKLSTRRPRMKNAQQR